MRLLDLSSEGQDKEKEKEQEEKDESRLQYARHRLALGALQRNRANWETHRETRSRTGFFFTFCETQR